MESPSDRDCLRANTGSHAPSHEADWGRTREAPEVGPLSVATRARQGQTPRGTPRATDQGRGRRWASREEVPRTTRSPNPELPLVGIGASAGGIEPLLQIVRGLPADFPGCLLVVVHGPARGPSALPAILGRAGVLPAQHATDGKRLAASRIFVAPPDHHLTVEGAVLRVRRGPMINRSRPAIDPLFQSMALREGPMTAVLLSGANDDGAAGLAAVATAGGHTIVQDPNEALYAPMPEAALRRVPHSHRLSAARIADAILAGLSSPPSAKAPPATADRLRKEMIMTELDRPAVTSEELDGDPSVFGCPACGGILFELSEGKDFRFRCRVGHAYSPETLLESQGGSVEDALWIALRALDEQASLARRLAKQAKSGGQPEAGKRFAAQATTAEGHADVVRQVLQLEPGSQAPGRSGGNGSVAAAITETGS